MSDLSECVFCGIIAKKSKESYDNILYETKSFVVITGLGAFVEGYLIIVPKNHIKSMAELTLNDMKELKELKNRIKNAYQKLYQKNMIVFENGSSGTENGRFKNSIVHAHLHFIPINVTNNIIHKIFKGIKYQKIISEQILLYRDKPYIFFENNYRIKFISTDIENVKRQHIRSIIAEELGVEKYNWRENYYIENCINTVCKFEKIFNEDKINNTLFALEKESPKAIVYKKKYNKNKDGN